MRKLYHKVIKKLQIFLNSIKINELKTIYSIPNSEFVHLDLCQMLQTIDQYVLDIDLVIDVGANEGMFTKSLYWFKKYKEAILFEPNKDLNTTIKRNVQNVKPIIINKALSDCEKRLIYYYHSDTQMNSLISCDSNALREEFGDKEIRCEEIQTSTIDIEISKRKIQLQGKKIFLKLDTQGNELDIIKGSPVTLINTTYCLIEFIVSSPYLRKNKLEDILFTMHNYDFECIGPVYLKKRSSYEIGAVNFLFKRITK